jgi:hypothetical protein
MLAFYSLRRFGGDAGGVTIEIDSMFNIHLTLKSANVKTGPIPVTTSSASTCPDACPLKAGGCYAKGGPLGMHWQKVSKGERGGLLSALVRQIESFPAGQVWRHNQAGDLPGLSDYIDARALHKLTMANKGRRGFTYTHKPVEGSSNLATSNRAAVRHANANGFTINLSANSLSHADRLADLNAGPVVAVVPENAPDTMQTPAGRKAIVCPAQQRDDITCATCQLCSRANRSVIIAFRAHGASKRKAEAIANA